MRLSRRSLLSISGPAALAVIAAACGGSAPPAAPAATAKPAEANPCPGRRVVAGSGSLSSRRCLTCCRRIAGRWCISGRVTSRFARGRRLGLRRARRLGG